MIASILHAGHRELSDMIPSAKHHDESAGGQAGKVMGLQTPQSDCISSAVGRAHRKPAPSEGPSTAIGNISSDGSAETMDDLTATAPAERASLAKSSAAGTRILHSTGSRAGGRPTFGGQVVTSGISTTPIADVPNMN